MSGIYSTQETCSESSSDKIKVVRRTGASPHFAAFASEPARTLLFPLLSHATETELNTSRQTTGNDDGTYMVQVVERTEINLGAGAPICG